MADVLSSRERELIAAFPTHQITRVPAGVSGLQPLVGGWKPSAAHSPGARVRRRAEERAVNARIAAMHRDGWTVARIAEAIGKPDTFVRAAIRGLKALGVVDSGRAKG